MITVTVSMGDNEISRSYSKDKEDFSGEVEDMLATLKEQDE